MLQNSNVLLIILLVTWKHVPPVQGIAVFVNHTGIICEGTMLQPRLALTISACCRRKVSRVAAGFNSRNLANSSMVMVHIHTEFNLFYEKKNLFDMNDGNLCLVELKAR